MAPVPSATAVLVGVVRAQPAVAIPPERHSLSVAGAEVGGGLDQGEPRPVGDDGVGGPVGTAVPELHPSLEVGRGLDQEGLLRASREPLPEGVTLELAELGEAGGVVHERGIVGVDAEGAGGGLDGPAVVDC